VHAHAVVGEPAQQPRRRVAVGVVGPDRHQRHPRTGPGEEVRIGVGAAVVRHLEDVGGQVEPVADEPLLRLGSEVAGEQDPQAVHGHPRDHAEVVGGRSGHRPVGRRREHLELGRSDAHAITRLEHRPGARGAPEHRVQCGGPVVVGCERTRGHRADVAAGQRSGQTADVVGVEVAEQHQRQLVDAQPVEAAVDRADLRTGVHQHSRAGPGRHHERVPLADVAGDEHRAVHRPAARHLPQRPADDHHCDQRHQCEHPHTGRPPQHHDGAQQQKTEQQAAQGTLRPGRGSVGQGGGALGDDHQPAHRPAGRPHQ
jgi:hypothetical protein